jgi:hypothetical protein
MEHNPYYDGLSDKDLDQDNWLIVAIELLWYCESHNADHCRYNQLRSRCNEVLNSVTDGHRTEFGGNFDTIINSDKYERFWQIDRSTKKNQTRIIPNIQVLHDEIRGRKIEILNRKNNRVTRIINKVDNIIFPRKVTEHVPVSDIEFEPRV